MSKKKIEDKQEFDSALDEQMEQALAVPEVQHVHVSGEAQHALAEKLRQWSGWDDASLILSDPRTSDPNAMSDAAMVDKTTHTFHANPDILVLNPNRVLYTITPFRLRQEAVLTGALLHECGHARFSNWHSEENLTHDNGNGEPVNKQTMSLARLMEEPRVEGLIAKQSPFIGASGLDWTMRACAHELLPMTQISRDPDQAVMDVITSWALRAGRELALAHWTDHKTPRWALQFGNLLVDTLTSHFDRTPDVLQSARPRPSHIRANEIYMHLIDMLKSNENKSTFMVDQARAILLELFPETDGNDPNAPMAGAGCVGEGQPQDSEPSEDEGEPSAETVALAEALEQMEDEAEAKAGESIDADAEQATQKALDEQGGGDKGGQGTGSTGGGWRSPDKTEREIAKGAERFLRTLIAPSESSRTTLSDQPSATVDAAALAAWKAGGEVRDPRFFRQTRRFVEPAAPVDIAVLVDISGSMESLQEPSATLSWALASAALDLRNYAGRGQQIRSCLIHWGDYANVIQGVGQQLPGIREVRCNDGTGAMAEAMALIEDQMPGFYDLPTDGVGNNRLIVHFTDWELNYHSRPPSAEIVGRALAAGVNMVTVAPRDYSPRRGALDQIMGSLTEQRGRNSLFLYDEKHPMSVWDHAAEALS